MECNADLYEPETLDSFVNIDFSAQFANESTVVMISSCASYVQPPLALDPRRLPIHHFLGLGWFITFEDDERNARIIQAFVFSFPF